MASSTLYAGWGRAGWGAGSWGRPILVMEVDGSAGTGAVGSVTVSANTANVFPIGVAGTGQVGTVNVWGDIVPTPGNSWNYINPSGGIWVDVVPGVTPDWTDVAA